MQMSKVTKHMVLLARPVADRFSKREDVFSLCIKPVTSPDFQDDNFSNFMRISTI